MVDLRREERKALVYYPRVFDTRSQLQLGNLVDITSLGAMLLSSTPVPVGVVFDLKLELSAEIADIPFLELSAQSLWCRADTDPALFNSGFKFLNVSQDQVSIIQRIIEIYGFRDN